MARKQTVALGDLQAALVKYRDILQHARDRTHKFDEEGNLIKVEPAVVENAFRKLKDAETAVSAVCEQAVLAIQVEP